MILDLDIFRITLSRRRWVADLSQSYR